MSLSLLLLAHVERIINRRCHVDNVPGIDQNRTGTQRLRCPCKLAQHQHSCIGILTCHVFVRHQVHAVSQRGHEEHIGDGIQRTELFKPQLSVEVENGYLGQLAEFAVDTTHNFMHHAGQPLVLGHLCTRRDCNLSRCKECGVFVLPSNTQLRRHISYLHQAHFVIPLGMLLQKLFKRQQLLWNALDHIQPIHPKHHFAAPIVFAQLGDAFLYPLRFHCGLKTLWVNANGECGYAGQGAIVLYTLGGTLGKRWVTKEV